MGAFLSHFAFPTLYITSVRKELLHKNVQQTLLYTNCIRSAFILLYREFTCCYPEIGENNTKYAHIPGWYAGIGLYVVRVTPHPADLRQNS